MPKLTIHALDMAIGHSANGLSFRLYLPNGQERAYVTNKAGRTTDPLLEETDFEAGVYKLIFDLKRYYATQLDQPTAVFCDHITIEFNILKDQSYHIPLLITPWSYSVYRGC